MQSGGFAACNDLGHFEFKDKALGLVEIYIVAGMGAYCVGQLVTLGETMNQVIIIRLIVNVITRDDETWFHFKHDFHYHI